MGPSSTRFEELPARPPTPPRESSNAAGANAASPNPLQQLKSRVARPRPDIYTPPDDPPSPGLHRASSKSAKRVGFSSWPEYHKDHAEPEIKPLPPSRERKSAKSILKPSDRLIPLLPLSTDDHSPGRSLSAHTYPSFAAMLESVTQQLASESRDSRLDAYLTIVGTLKAYDGEPDSKAMADKMSLFMQFTLRDLSATLPGSGSVDATLVLNALRFLTHLAWNQQLADHITDEYRISVLDHAINVLENPATPKQLVNQYLAFFSEQRFSRVMTADRANRILKALSKIDDYVKGNGVVGARLAAYSNLLRQIRPAMVAKVDDWISHLFTGMLSGLKEIQARAIAFGLDAGLALGNNGQVSRSLMDFFNKMDNGRRNADYLSDRLTRMMATKETAVLVPQIWSVVVLFLRCPNYKLENWEHMKLWFLTIQKCFNSSDIIVKSQANVAWNKLIFAVLPGTDTSASMVKMLRQPLSGQLERRPLDKHTQRARQVALSSYCNLIYYSMRPSASPEQLDMYWREYVSHLVQLLAAKQEGSKACEILSSMFDGTESKRWVEERATESTPIQPSDLPRLDPKWVRSRIQCILKDVETILKDDSWTDENAPVRQLWRNLLKTIADAGSKEVKVSQDLREALAQLFNLFQRIWRRAFTSLSVSEYGDEEAFSRGYAFIVKTTMECLGEICFTEKFLSQNPQHKFEAAPTPSTRLPRPVGEVRSPVLCLIQLLLEPSAAANHMSLFQGLVRELLTTCTSRGTRKKRLDFLKEVALMLKSQQSTLSTRGAVTGCWEILADVTRSIVAEHNHRDTGMENIDPLGHEYRDVVKILEMGVKLGPVSDRPWRSLFLDFISMVRREVGDGGSVLAVIEPLADVIGAEPFEKQRAGMLTFASVLLDETTWPRDRQALERARKTLWGVAPAYKPVLTFDPFTHLYEMISNILTASYRSVEACKPDSISLHLTAVTGLLHRCPDSLIAIVLKRLQEGLRVWLEDPDDKLKTSNTWVQVISAAVYALWDEVLMAFKQRLQGRTNNTLLQNLDRLISSSLMSRRKLVVNGAIEMWNSTFGNELTLEYPDIVRKALTRLRPIAELQLPTFPDSAEDQIAESPPTFSDSQDEAEITLPTVERFSTPLPAEPRHRLILSAGRTNSSPSSARKLHLPSSTHSSKRASTPRLRHDDSQIAFAAIDSSPLGDDALESQALTERQKEVKERQQAEAAAMFPDLRSYTKISRRTNKSELPPFTLSSDLASTGELPVNGSTTPTLPPPSRGPAEDYVASSPTPSKSQSVNLEDDEPPSSPPQLPNETIVRLSSSPTAQLHYEQDANLLDQVNQDHGEMDGIEITVNEDSPAQSGSLRELQAIAAEEEPDDLIMEDESGSLQRHIDSLESSLEPWDKADKAKLDGLPHTEFLSAMSSVQRSSGLSSSPSQAALTIDKNSSYIASATKSESIDSYDALGAKSTDIERSRSRHTHDDIEEIQESLPQSTNMDNGSSPTFVDVQQSLIAPQQPMMGLRTNKAQDPQSKETDDVMKDDNEVIELRPYVNGSSTKSAERTTTETTTVADLSSGSMSPESAAVLIHQVDPSDDTPSQDSVRRSSRKRKRMSVESERITKKRTMRPGGNLKTTVTKKEQPNQDLKQPKEEIIYDCIVVDTSARRLQFPSIASKPAAKIQVPLDTRGSSPPIESARSDTIDTPTADSQTQDQVGTEGNQAGTMKRRSIKIVRSSPEVVIHNAPRRRSRRLSAVSNLSQGSSQASTAIKDGASSQEEQIIEGQPSLKIDETEESSERDVLTTDPFINVGNLPVNESSSSDPASTGQEVLEQLRSIRDRLAGAVFGSALLGEIDDVLHDIRGGAREAVQRSIS